MNTTLILSSGLSGTGKTTLARALAKKLHVSLLSMESRRCLVCGLDKK